LLGALTLIGFPWPLLLVAGCAQNHDAAPAAPALAAPAASAAETRLDPEAAAAEMGFRRKHKPLDPSALQALLPAAFDRLRLKEPAKAEATGGPETRYTLAEAEYEDAPGGAGDRASLLLRITDLAGAGVSAAESTGWARLEIHSESVSGFERTTAHGGRRAFEKFDAPSRRAEAQLLVADRFLVEASGKDLPLERVWAAVDSLDLARLDAMKNADGAEVP
jgi:hypothetical protein